ncbi:MAG: citrate lyase subunit alpha [Clostridia bacterium]
MNKLLDSIAAAISECGLKSGMTISFHHHLRNGDHVLNMVMEAIAASGLRDISINASSLFDVHAPLINHIKSGVVTSLECGYMSGRLAAAISEGVLSTPVVFRSHGGRPAALAAHESCIDVAFIAAPTADTMGNCSGKYGKSACGSLGYAFADAQYAKRVVVITDNLVAYPLADFSIDETHVDYVVAVDSIGDPAGIISGTTNITRDPIGLIMAAYAARIMDAADLIKDGMSFQTGAGGASLATAKYLKDIMVQRNIRGSFGLGGITGYLVDMLEENCFESLLDVQCFDLRAVESIRTNPRHREISAMQYASPTSKSAAVDHLDVVILGATQIDTDFNVNVHTDSNGYIIGGSGGHSDAAAGASLTMIIAPLTRARLSIVVDHVGCISTPGSSIDVLVTQHGIAVNPAKADLALRLKDAGLPVMDIFALKEAAQQLTGIPQPISLGERIVANVFYRDGTQIDSIRCVK